MQVEVLLILVEGLAAEQSKLLEQAVGINLLVAQERDVADRVARPLVDHEIDRQPVLFFIELQFAANAGLEEAEAPVIGGKPAHILVDLLAVDLAGNEIGIERMGLDDRFQPGTADEVVADEVQPRYSLPRTFVDDEHGPQIAGLVAFQDGDADLAMAFVLVVFFNFSPAVFHRGGVGRITHLEFGLFPEDRGQVGVVADDDDLLDQRPLEDCPDGVLQVKFSHELLVALLAALALDLLLDLLLGVREARPPLLEFLDVGLVPVQHLLVGNLLVVPLAFDLLLDPFSGRDSLHEDAFFAIQGAAFGAKGRLQIGRGSHVFPLHEGLELRLIEVAIDGLLDCGKGFFRRLCKEVLVDQFDGNLPPHELLDERAVRGRHALDRIGVLAMRVEFADAGRYILDELCPPLGKLLGRNSIFDAGQHVVDAGQDIAGKNDVIAHSREDLHRLRLG